jgi:hypothetical protein
MSAIDGVDGSRFRHRNVPYWVLSSHACCGEETPLTLHEQGSPAFEAAMPILSQLLKAEMAEREVRSIVSAVWKPLGNQLDGWKFHGRRSSMRLFG